MFAGNKNLGDFKGYCSEFGSGKIFRMGNCRFKGYIGWYNGVLG